MATRPEISEFLAAVERRAFKQVVYTVRDDDTALDIVQDAMLKLVEKYADRPVAELAPLFQRILQNATHDHFRRQKVRRTWVSLFSSLPGMGNADDDAPTPSTACSPRRTNATPKTPPTRPAGPKRCA